MFHLYLKSGSLSEVAKASQLIKEYLSTDSLKTSQETIPDTQLPTEYSKKLLEGYDLKRPIKAISNGVDTTFFEKNDKFGNKFRKTMVIKKMIK